MSIAWQPHGSVFATSGQDASVALWDGAIRPGDQALETRSHADAGAGFAPGGEMLAAATGKNVTLWSPLGEKIHAFAPAASSAVALAFDRPGTDLGVALNGELAVHRIEKSRYETRRYKWPAACLTVNFSGNGRFLASGMADGSLHFWNRSTGKDSQMRGYDGKLELVGWSDNSRYLASSAGNEVVLWDFSGNGPEGTRPIVLNGHTERVDSFAWQPGGDHLVSAGRDWRLDDVATGEDQATHRRTDARFGRQRGALVARRQTTRGRREAGTPHRVRARRAMKVELRDLAPDERREVQQRFDLLVSKRFAPSPKKPRHEVWWPKAPLDGRAFPEGIQPPDGDDSFNESARLIGFLNGVCGAEFYIANLSAPHAAFPAHRKTRRRACQVDSHAPGVESHLPAGVDPRRVPHHRLADGLLGDRRSARSHRTLREALRWRRGTA